MLRLARLSAFALTLSVWALPAHSLVLVQDGRPTGSIVLPADPNGNLQAAATLLQRIIERSSGAKLPIAKSAAGAGTTIEVGATPASLVACPEAAKLKTDGVVVRVRDGKLFITAQNTYAVRIAAVRFLEEVLGVRWLFPGELGEIVPAHPTVTVADSLNLVEEPDLQSRMFSGMFGADLSLWRLHLTLQFHHNLSNIVPPATYAKTHPEYFPMIGGKRHIPSDTGSGWQPETTNPEVVQIAVAAAGKWFTDHPEETSFSLGVTDGRGESYSPEAVALDDKLGPPTPTNRFYHFYNQVAEGLAQTHPDKLLGILNYPPLHGVPTVPLHKNLLVYCWRGSDGGVRPAEWYGKWPNLCFCDWLYGCFYCMPRHYPHAYADLIRHYYQGGFRGMYAEAYPNWPIDGPKLYALSRVMWRLDTDVSAAVAEYLKLAFGPAAAPAGEFFTIAERAMERRDPPDVFSKWSASIRGEFRVWSLQDLAGMENAVTAMEAAVAREPAGDNARRVKLFRDAWDWYAVHMKMDVEARALQALKPGTAPAEAELLTRAEALSALPDHRDQLWDQVVSRQKNVLWGTDQYRQIIAVSDPAAAVQDGVYDALARLDEAWQARMAPAQVAAQWAQARVAHPGLAGPIRVREQIAGQLDATRNPVINPGFEQELQGWHTWVRAGTQMEVRLDKGQRHSGETSAYMGPGTIACYVQDVKANPGDTFYLSCWARRATGAGVCALKVWWKSATGADLGLAQWERRAGDRPGEWQKLELYGQVPAKAGIAEILLLGQEHGKDDGCWFDDLMALVLPQG